MAGINLNKLDLQQLRNVAAGSDITAPLLLAQIKDGTVSKVNIRQAEKLIEDLERLLAKEIHSFVEAFESSVTYPKISEKLELAKEIKAKLESQYDKQGIIESWKENYKDNKEEMNADLSKAKKAISNAHDVAMWGIDEGLVKPVKQKVKSTVIKAKDTADVVAWGVEKGFVDPLIEHGKIIKKEASETVKTLEWAGEAFRKGRALKKSRQKKSKP